MIVVAGAAAYVASTTSIRSASTTAAPGVGVTAHAFASSRQGRLP
jgi:hypothetical protein